MIDKYGGVARAEQRVRAFNKWRRSSDVAPESFEELDFDEPGDSEEIFAEHSVEPTDALSAYKVVGQLE